MRTEKRMKIELRDIVEKKREAIAELSDLRNEVALLREERDGIKKEKEVLVSEIHITQSENESKIQYARQELARIEKQKRELIDSVSKLQTQKTDTEGKIRELNETISNIVELKHRAETETFNAITKRGQQLAQNAEAERLGYNLTKKLEDVQSQTQEANRTLTQVKSEITQEVEKLNQILKEQERNSNWADYLEDKENFLAEQFPLLGVKFVRYNSK